ncbi:MAG: hypothetical protein JXL80_16650, partial [Planctomycetes bacterium]|nr:hypothetical protein [Planctomycetota bacterium]
AALATDSGEVYPVNIAHGGAVPGFDPETVLELYCHVGRNGFKPEGNVPLFPAAIVAQQTHVAAFQRMVVTAILEKNREGLLAALCVHPFTKSMARATELFEAMWSEERDTLGAYWADVK